MLPTVKICLKSDYIKKDETVNVRIRITYKRKACYFPLGIFVKPSQFSKGRILKSHPRHWQYNMLLIKYYEKASKIIFDLEMADQQFTFEKFEKRFKDDHYGSDVFETFALDFIKSNKGIVAYNTTRMYKSQVNKVQEFAPGITFNDITPAFIKEFEYFLIHVKENNTNTRIKTFTVLKALLNQAMAQGLIRNHALEDYKKGTIQGNREFLIMEELKILQQVHDSGELPTSQLNVLRYFLFACYTGLRYEDIKRLCWKHIQDRSWINIYMHKTKLPVRIPIIDTASRLLPPDPGQLPSLRVFRVLSNQPTNRYLKDIIRDAGISRIISFHCARHTFATVALDCGMSLETVSKILGHTELKTTQIYARIRDGRKSSEIKKFDQALQPDLQKGAKS